MTDDDDDALGFVNSHLMLHCLRGWDECGACSSSILSGEF